MRRKLSAAAQALLAMRAVYERQRSQGKHTPSMGWAVRSAKRAWRLACADLTEDQVSEILRNPHQFLEVTA